MRGIPKQFDFPLDSAEFRTVVGRPGVELYRAHIVQYAFEPHTHEAYGFGAIESGVERFRYKGSDHLAPPDSIVLMNPDVLHTGKAETDGGWLYQMIYIEPELLAEVTGDSGWWFPDVVVEGNRDRAKRLSILLAALWQAKEPLAFDSLLYQVALEVRPHARANNVAKDSLHRFTPVLDYIEAHISERIALEELAAVANLSPFHFLRQFKMQYDVTPHQMLMARRLYAAKQLLATGMVPAMVAATTGLTDQSHLNRAFLRRYGVTPARYQRQVYKLT